MNQETLPIIGKAPNNDFADLKNKRYIVNICDNVASLPEQVTFSPAQYADLFQIMIDVGKDTTTNYVELYDLCPPPTINDCP